MGAGDPGKLKGVETKSGCGCALRRVTQACGLKSDLLLGAERPDLRGEVVEVGGVRDVWITSPEESQRADGREVQQALWPPRGIYAAFVLAIARGEVRGRA
jgi:hypothetical protein